MPSGFKLNKNEVDAICTLPINKESWSKSRYKI